MGMQVSSYEIIAALAGEAHGESAGIIREALAEFAMVAVVLHRPGIDIALNAVLQREFARLDRETGRHLLFFALTEAGADWHEHAGQRLYYRALRATAAYAHQAPLQWADSDAAASAIAMRLGIPGDSLPCIIFTGDLARDEFAWTQTSPELLARQLISLGQVASDLAPSIQPKRFMPPRVRRPAPAQLDLAAVAQAASVGAPCGGGERGKRLSDACLDIIAVGAMKGVGSPEREAREARGQAVLAKLQAEIDVLRGQVGEKNAELPDRIYDLAQLRSLKFPPLRGGSADATDGSGGGLRIVRASGPGTLANFTGLMLGTFDLARQPATESAPHSEVIPPWQTWHSDARSAVVTADKLLVAFAGDKDFDWSTVAVSTGKSLEIEANYSVVQLIRQHLGASMPETYHRVAPNLELRIASGNQEINLNDTRGGAWAPVTLGVIAHLLGHHVTVKASQALGAGYPDPGPRLQALERVSFALAKLRNLGAHQASLQLAEAQQARAELDKLALNGGAEFLRACKVATAPASP